MISAWRGRVTPMNMALHHEMALELRHRHLSLTMMVVISPFISLPTAGERASLAAYYQVHGPHLKGVANVVLGEGFFASAARAVLSALLTCSPKPYPMKIFPSTSSAALWLQPLTVHLHPKDPEFVATLRQLSIFLGAPVSYHPPRRSRPPG